MIILQKPVYHVEKIVNIVMYGEVNLNVAFVLLITVYLKIIPIVNLTQELINAEVARLVYGKVIQYAKNVSLIIKKINMDLVNLYVRITANTVDTILLSLVIKNL